MPSHRPEPDVRYHVDSYTGEGSTHLVCAPVEGAGEDLKTLYCGACGFHLPVEEFMPSMSRYVFEAMDTGDRRRGTAECRVCSMLKTKKYRKKFEGNQCDVADCEAPVNVFYSTRQCSYHARGGNHSLCGCRSCRGGWDAPAVIARSEASASEHCWLYLLRLEQDGHSALVYGLSRNLSERLQTYRRECAKEEITVSVLSKAPADYLTCAETERLLHRATARAAWSPPISGASKENMEDSARSLDAFEEMVRHMERHRRHTDPAGWEARRQSYLN